MLLLDGKCMKQRDYMGKHVTKAERERSGERGVTLLNVFPMTPNASGTEELSLAKVVCLVKSIKL